MCSCDCLVCWTKFLMVLEVCVMIWYVSDRFCLVFSMVQFVGSIMRRFSSVDCLCGFDIMLKALRFDLFMKDSGYFSEVKQFSMCVSSSCKYWAAYPECSEEETDDDPCFNGFVVVGEEVYDVVFVCGFSVYAEEEVIVGSMDVDIEKG